MRKIIKEETKGLMHGVEGTFKNVYQDDQTKLITKQVFLSDWKDIGKSLKIQVEVRFDDECGNKHESFAITGTVKGKGEECMCGCIHDEIEKHSPQLKHLVKWHLTSTDEPMHYVANAVYHASDKDCWGRRKGEPSSFKKQIVFKGCPVPYNVKDSLIKLIESGKVSHWLSYAIPHDKNVELYGYKYGIVGFEDSWYKASFDDKLDAQLFCEALNTIPYEILKTPSAYSEGKERDLNAARSCALWPEATDEQLMGDNLKELLEARLPQLQADFKEAMINAGLIWPDRLI